jgi:putative addiction module killer protein
VIEVRPYIDHLGRNPFRRWFEKLDANTKVRIAASIARVSDGNLSAGKSVGGGVSELRLDFGPGYRIYYGRDGDTLVILLGGGTKQRQDEDIQIAKKLWRDYKKRKKENDATQ